MNTIKIFAAIVLLVVGVYIGTFFSGNSSLSSSSEFDFLNPTVTSSTKKHFVINFLELKKQLEKIQKKYPQKTYIYFNYLNNSAWIGLGERDTFYAASTIKVPLAMATLKAVEEGKLKMSDIYALESFDLDINFGNLYKEGEGKEISVEDLTKIMLEQSDNTAMFAIIEILGRVGIDAPFDDVYNKMGWDFAILGEKPTYEEINLKTLSNMFLSLYNATYLNWENSEKILSFLSQSPFNDKIVAGVPKDIKVSHKIGVAVEKGTFSDCGIVYAPNRNYLLCLGSAGGNEDQAKKFMEEVSESVYKFVINH